MSRVWIVGLVAIGSMSVSLPVANAYVDPGAGSLIFQATVGGVLAIGVVAKVFWRRAVGAIWRRKGEPFEA
jgi:hypothetical protein